ncbi:MAG TPA: thioredoxin family protein [bacterium]|nr:thioredoxin family protein [bacterium]
MGLLKEKDAKQLRDAFAQLPHEVKLLFFTQEFECQHCQITRELVTELAGLSDKITLETYNFVTDKQVVERYNIDKIPAIVVLGERDYGIRLYGVPAGYEFATLVEDIIDVGRRDPGLPAEIVAALQKIDKPVRLQVMVSPTCPYCPRAVRTAHKFAMINDNIVGDMVEISEFPFLAQKYDVQGVPKTIINEKWDVVGAAPEQQFLAKIQEALAG